MMEYKEAGYDFDRIKTARISKKNHSYAYVSLIFFIVFFSLFATFLVLYLIGIPFEIDGIIRHPGDLPYQKFFFYFLGITGMVSFLMIATMIPNLLARANDYIWIGSSAEGEKEIYVRDRYRETYLDESLMIMLDRKNQRTTYSESKTEIEAGRCSALFWEELKNVKLWIEKSRPGMHKIKYRLDRGNIRFIKTYILYFDNFGNLFKYRETVYTVFHGNSNLKSFCTYYVNDLNKYVRLPIDKEIENVVFQIKSGI